MDNKQIGNYIRSLRTKKGLTQGNLAEQLDVSRQAVSKWENGIAIPDVSLLPKLSKLLDMDIEGILYGEPHELACNIAGVISLWIYENNGISMTDIVNDKPLLVYPLSMLLLCGIKNIVICGPKELLISAKKIIDDSIQKTDIIVISYFDELESLTGSHIVLIDGNSYLYGIDLTRYLQRTIVNKNSISCIACAKETVLDVSYRWFPFISIPKFDKNTIAKFEMCKKKSIKFIIEDSSLSRDVNMEVIGRGMLSFEVNDIEELLDFSEVMRLISKTQCCDISNPDKIIIKRYTDAIFTSPY